MGPHAVAPALTVNLDRDHLLATVPWSIQVVGLSEGHRQLHPAHRTQERCLDVDDCVGIGLVGNRRRKHADKRVPETPDRRSDEQGDPDAKDRLQQGATKCAR